MAVAHAPESEAASNGRASVATTSGLVDRVLIRLGRRDFRADAAALAMALRGCDAAKVPALIDQLLELAHTPAAREALGLAARSFDRLAEDKRQRLVTTGHGQWGEAIEFGTRDAYPDELASIANLVGQTFAPEALPHLCTLIRDEHDLVAAAAGRALVRAAHRANTPPQLDELTRQSIEAVILRAAQDFPDHRRKEPLLALLILLSTPAAWAASGAELRTFLQDHEHPAVLAMRSIVKKDIDPLTRAAAWQWVSYEPLRAASLDRLYQHAHVDGQQAVLGAEHLLHNPFRSRALAKARSRERAESSIIPDPVHIEHLSMEAARGAFALADAMARDDLPLFVENVLGDPRPAVRFRAMSVCDASNPEHMDLLSDLALDPDPHIARSAVLATSSPDRELLARSPHADVRAIAAMSAPDSTLARLAGFSSNRAAFTRVLQVRLMAGSTPERISVILAARRLRIIPDLELELLTIIQRAADVYADPTRSDDQRVAATAASALADARTPSAELALTRALNHPDLRVRANALDALGRVARRQSRPGTPSPILAAIVEFKSDSNHRLRAGALRADLLASIANPDIANPSPHIVQALLPLLTDQRPQHRLSGLWLAERMVPQMRSGWTETGATQAIAGVVAEQAEHDPDLSIRRRATLAAAVLNAQIRAAWSGASA